MVPGALVGESRVHPAVWRTSRTSYTGSDGMGGVGAGHESLGVVTAAR